MQDLITKKIKDVFKTKSNFAEQMGFSRPLFSSKLRAIDNRINWLNDFLKPLNLEVVIKEKDSVELDTILKDLQAKINNYLEKKH